jgi:hypothetical protein
VFSRQLISEDGKAILAVLKANYEMLKVEA